jgi:hypothetical protein
VRTPSTGRFTPDRPRAWRADCSLSRFRPGSRTRNGFASAPAFGEGGSEGGAASAEVRTSARSARGAECAGREVRGARSARGAKCAGREVRGARSARGAKCAGAKSAGAEAFSATWRRAAYAEAHPLHEGAWPS